MTGKDSRQGGVTWRSIAVGLLLIPINVYWVTITEVRWYALDGSCLPLFITPIFILFVLALLNILVSRISRRAALTRDEMLTAYIMVVISSVMASHDLFQNMFGAIGWPYRMATPDNQYQKLFFQFLPKWLLITDKNALAGYYQGGVSPYQNQILVHWIVPLAGWTILMLVMMMMMLCMNVIIRKQWTENEKLVFPLVQLPIAMSEGGGLSGFFKSRTMWIGFGLAFLIGLINGLHHLYPAYPELTGVKQYEIGQYVTTFPWNAIGPTTISMYPFAIGIAYFIPLDLSFSCWFFFVGRKLFQVVGASYGWAGPENAGFPFFDEQASGAWLALAIVILYGTRKYLVDVLRIARGGKDLGADAAETRTYRVAIGGIIFGMLFLMGFSNVLQMSPWVAVVFFGIYFLLSITITRVRAELGTPHEIYFVNPQRIMVSIFGTKLLGVANLTLISTMYWFNRGYRSHPMPNQLESFRMAEGTDIKRNHLIAVLALATIVGILVTYWANLHIGYRDGIMAKAIGAKNWVGLESFDRLTAWINVEEPRPPCSLGRIVGGWLTVRMAYMIGGALFVVFLRLMRGAFIWWPFHPAGYALAVSFAMEYFWFAFFVSWLIKSLLVRYGGMKLHNYAVPFFLGLILGDFTIGSIWAIIGPATGIQAYKIFI